MMNAAGDALLGRLLAALVAARARTLGASEPLRVLDPFALAGISWRSGGATRAVRLLDALDALSRRRGVATELWLATEDRADAEWFAAEAAGRVGASAAAVRVLAWAPEQLIQELRAATGAAPGAATLAVLAPPSAAHLPWALSEQFADDPTLDLLVVPPVHEPHRQARYRDLPVADLPPPARRAVQGCSAFLGDLRHAWLGAWRRTEAAAGAVSAEAGFADAYAARLLERSPGAEIVHALRLEAAGGDVPDSTALHLVQRAAGPEVVLALNEAIRAVGLRDVAVWSGGRAAPRRAAPAAAAEPLDLFATQSEGCTSLASGDGVVDVSAVADLLVAAFRTRTVAWGEMLRWAAETDLTLPELRRALGAARGRGAAVYGPLRAPESTIRFPAQPVPRGPTRRSAAEGLALFDDAD